MGIINLFSTTARAVSNQPAPAPVVATIAQVFDLTPAPVVTGTGGGPRAVVLRGRDDTWCQSRPGTWWPSQGLWVDRLALHTGDVAPAGAGTYPLTPGPGLAIGAVHGQRLAGVAHVLVTDPAGAVITQGTGQVGDRRDLALVVLATLILAAGHGSAPTAPMVACLSDRVVRDIAGEDWDAPGGWTLPADDLPRKVLLAIGR